VDTGERGGLLVRYGEDESRTTAFIPAEVARGLVALSAVTPVPGVRPPARGIALAHGELLTVLELGPAALEIAPRSRRAEGEDKPLPGSDRAVLCVLGGLPVALIGGTVIASGIFEATEEGVRFAGEAVPTLDVRALYAQAESAIWRERAASWRPKARCDEEGEGSV